jgi:hypothetical protein
MSVPPSPTPGGGSEPPTQWAATGSAPVGSETPAARDEVAQDAWTPPVQDTWTPPAQDAWMPPAQDAWMPPAQDAWAQPVQAPGAAGPAWGPPPPVWAPTWEPPPMGSPVPGGFPHPSPAALPAGSPAGPAPRSRGNNPVTLALVAVAALLAGAAGAGFLTTALFVSGAENIGREMAEEMGPRIGAAMGEEVTASMEDALDAFMGGETYAEPVGPVEQFPAIEPGDLGPDPVLDDYADSCFDGDLQACDDLYYSAPPMSDYEEYAGTCGGRVKLFAVMSCLDLE